MNEIEAILQYQLDVRLNPAHILYYQEYKK